MSTQTVPSVDVAEAYAMYQRGDVLVDVREPHETAGGHPRDARLIPLQRLPQHHQDLPETRILVVCATGNRSSVATEQLRRAGHDAVNVEGGMAAWRASGLPVTR